MSQQIKDSGSRTKFNTGAVRDGESNKGRFDLLPMDTLNSLNFNVVDLCYPYLAIWALARHFEEGAKKYNERNWEKGIPISTFYNSAWRHLIKEQYQWVDEPHLAAIVWNLVCMLWTIDKINHKELPQELWDLPFPITEIDYKVPKDTYDDNINLLSICKEKLIDYMNTNVNNTMCLVDATKIAISVLEYKERKTNGPQ